MLLRDVPFGGREFWLVGTPSLEGGHTALWGLVLLFLHESLDAVCNVLLQVVEEETVVVAVITLGSEQGYCFWFTDGEWLGLCRSMTKDYNFFEGCAF